MVTHDPRAAAVTDRVVFLKDGRDVGETEGGSTERVLDVFGRLTAPDAEVARPPQGIPVLV
jgi:putative ABC transport system ATP-binding protein